MILDYEIDPDGIKACNAKSELERNGIIPEFMNPYVRKMGEENPGKVVIRLMIEDGDWETAEVILTKHNMMPGSDRFS